MMFNSEEDVRAYYTRYAKQKGFGVSRRTSKLGDDGKSVKYFTLSCVCQGKAKSRAANPLKPQPKQNLGCKAKLMPLDVLMEDLWCLLLCLSITIF